MTATRNEKGSRRLRYERRRAARITERALQRYAKEQREQADEYAPDKRERADTAYLSRSGVVACLPDGVALSKSDPDADDLLSPKDDHLVTILLTGAHVGDQVRYDHARKRWHIWSGVRWEPDTTGRIYDLVRIAVNKLWDESDDHTSPGEWRKALMPLYDLNKKRTVLDALSSRPGIRMKGSEWDKPANLIGFENGVLDLDTTTLEPGRQEDLITKSVGYDWDDEAQCPTFEGFIQAICADEDGNRRPDVEDYVLLVSGAALYGHSKVQQVYLIIGPGSGGKGAYCRTLVYALGGGEEYAATPASNMYTKAKHGDPHSSGPRADLLKLYGRRIAWLDEPPGPLNDEMLKTHTGEFWISARDLHAKSEQIVSWLPTHTILMTSNVALSVEDVGVSMRRRVRVIPFLRSFVPDLTLEERMRAEAPGIIRLLAYAARRWRENPELLSDERNLPPAVAEASRQFIEESDPMTGFIAERCLLGSKYRVTAAALFEAWKDWCWKQGADGPDPGTLPAFARYKMANRPGITRDRTSRERSYIGIGLRDVSPDPAASGPKTTMDEDHDGA